MIRASATSGGSELYKAIVLPLQFLLVVYHKLEIPDVIQNESVMKASLEGTKRIREEGQRTNLQFKRVLEPTLCVVCEGSGRCEALQKNTSQMKSHSNGKMRKVKRHDTTN